MNNIKKFFKKNGSKIFWIAGGVILGAGGMYIAGKNGAFDCIKSDTVEKFEFALKENGHCFNNLNVLDGKGTIADLGKVGEDLIAALENAKPETPIKAVFITTPN